MPRMIIWAAIGAIVGFLVFCAMFQMAWPHGGPDRGVNLVFSIMGALPVAAICAVFSAVGTIKENLDEIRREIMRLQRIEELITIQERPSTQFKSGPPERGPS
ncbi:MAG: hypothetical protein EXR98_07500 [Gemmataceae bacterium]|nr:hypothetical protein [Gemmataceae bacterium]